MSQENVELVKHVVALGLRREWDAVAEYVAEDAVGRDLRPTIDTPDVIRGRDGWRAHVARFEEAFDEFTHEVDEFVDAGDWVICVGRWVGKAKGSGVEIEERGADAYRFRNGKMVEWTSAYPSKASALEAVGMR